MRRGALASHRGARGRLARAVHARAALALAALVASAAFFLAPGATRAAPAAVSVVDDRGVSVALERPARRIVSLLPSLTETVCMLDACDRLVATDRWSNWPPAVASLPKAGGLEDADIERIAMLRPDLVLAARSSRVIERLEALGIRVAAFEAHGLADLGRVTRALGMLVGAPDADRLMRRADAAIDAAARGLGAAERGLAVYFEVDSAPYAAGPTSFIGELLGRLGARNIVPAALGPFPKLNPEFVVRADPQVIVVSRRNADGLARRPGWSTVRALRPGQGHVCVFDSADFDVLVRPGPRLAEAATLLAGCLGTAARMTAPQRAQR